MQKDNEKERSEWETLEGSSYTSFERKMVDGGFIYRSCTHVPNEGISESLCFVPDIDLTRYQSHLRDAYNQGFKDGSQEKRVFQWEDDKATI